MARPGTAARGGALRAGSPADGAGPGCGPPVEMAPRVPSLRAYRPSRNLRRTSEITQICVISDVACSLLYVPTDAEIAFADHAASSIARRYGMAPVVGLLGYLAICDPREQSIAELAEALLAGGAIAGAVKTWSSWAWSAVPGPLDDGVRPGRHRPDLHHREASGSTPPSTRSRPRWHAKASRSSQAPRPSGGPCCWRWPRSPSG